MNRLISTGKLRIRQTLRHVGYTIEKARPPELAPNMDGGLLRAARRGTQVGSVIDVGASTGIWSARAMRAFPHARYLLVEAQDVHEAELAQFVNAHPGASYVLTAAGPHIGRVWFDVSDPFAGRAGVDLSGSHVVQVPVSTVDSLVEAWKLPPPFLLKLDTHGFEVPILEGAHETLLRTSLIIMECYNFNIPGALLFYEICSYLDRIGFRCIDVVDQMYRPGDLAFWQADLFFVRTSDKVFERNSYE